MRHSCNLSWILTVAVLLLSTYGQADEVHVNGRSLAYADLVARLDDLRALAIPPLPGERSGSATSYDRASHYDAKTDRYLDWRANADGTGFVRQSGDSIVAAELTGPGVVWRIWSASPQQGPIRFYVDGAEQPTLALPFSSLFDAERGPFRFNQLVREMARGWNCFVPIAYNRSLRIELGEGWGNYYQFTYSTFPEGTSVPSFTGKFTAEDLDALARANRAWAYRDQVAAPANSRRIERVIEIAPGESIDAITCDGAAAISEFSIELDETDADEQACLLRELTVAIHWDGEAQPSVWCPLGDFFGSAPGVHEYQSLPAGMHGRTLRSSWFMPFGSGAIVRLQNDGQVPRRLRVVAVIEPLDRPASGLLRFHAKWHRDTTGAVGPDRLRTDRYPDWSVLEVDATSGRFCGMQLHAWNPLHKWDDGLAAQFEQPTSELCPDGEWFQREVVGNLYWYGEGDEKFFVDGERFPSTFGTGTEDYFGFAWGTPATFDSATQAQTVNTNNTGHISLVRYHIADNVPFQKRFEAYLEKYHGNNWPLLYAATAYWYQSAGTADRYAPVAVGDRIGYEAAPTRRVPHVAADGVLEGEVHFVPANSATTRKQSMAFAGGSWSNGGQLLLEGRIGDQFVLNFSVAEPYQGDIALQLTQAPDYGVCDIALDDRQVANGVDCFADQVKLAPIVVIKEVSLDAGVHSLTLRITSANASARPFQADRYLLGLDVLRLQNEASESQR